MPVLRISQFLDLPVVRVLVFYALLVARQPAMVTSVAAGVEVAPAAIHKRREGPLPVPY
jgi:hypothetical protein